MCSWLLPCISIRWFGLRVPELVWCGCSASVTVVTTVMARTIVVTLNGNRQLAKSVRLTYLARSMLVVVVGLIVGVLIADTCC